VAVCRIEPAPFVHGEWNWQPALQWEPVWVVAATDATAPIGELGRLIDVAEWELTTVDELSIPYLYGQISEITFLVPKADPTSTDAKWTHLMTASFREGAPTGEQPAAVDAVAMINMQPLQFTTAHRRCRIALPQPVIERLEDRMSSIGLAEEGLVEIPSPPARS
jgi:hypothetical protein